VAEGLALPGEWFAAQRARYQEGRRFLAQGLEQAGYTVLPSAGTWFLSIDLAASGLPADDEAVAERLIREAGVATTPVSAFCRDDPMRGHLRFCFAKQRGTLAEALARLVKWQK